MLARWPSWAPRGEYLFIDQMAVIAPVMHIGCTQVQIPTLSIYLFVKLFVSIYECTLIYLFIYQGLEAVEWNSSLSHPEGGAYIHGEKVRQSTHQ